MKKNNAKLEAIKRSRKIGRAEAVADGTWSKRPAVFKKRKLSEERAKSLDREIRNYL